MRCVVTGVTRPELTDEERQRREQDLKKAAAALMLALRQKGKK